LDGCFSGVWLCGFTSVIWLPLIAALLNQWLRGYCFQLLRHYFTSVIIGWLRKFRMWVGVPDT